MNSKEYFIEILVPTVREFREHPHSRRHAYLACFVVYHWKDYLKFDGIDVEPLAKTFGRCTSWEVVRAVANATKHCQMIPNSKHPENISFTAGEDYLRPPCVAGLAVCDLSVIGDTVGGREVPGGLDIYKSVKVVLKNLQLHLTDVLGSLDISDC